MKILHNCITTQYRPDCKAHEESTRTIIRDRSLTEKGCERILNREALERNLGARPVRIVRVERFLLQ
jgi:hypothetical protein